jgi:hypothetical protein
MKKINQSINQSISLYAAHLHMRNSIIRVIMGDEKVTQQIIRNDDY